MRNAFSFMVAILAIFLAASPVWAVSTIKESTANSGAINREKSSQDLEEMRGSIRSMIGELAKNRFLLQEMTKEMLKEASRNKEVLKEVIRGIAQNKEMIKAVVKDVLADQEVQKVLRENRPLFKELLEEFAKTEAVEKPNGEKNR